MSFMLQAKTTVRSWARRLCVITMLLTIKGRLGHRSHAYEEVFAKSFLDAVQPGDCAWDVGANVGHYTLLLSERVGPSGTVCAFEPAPACFKQIEARQLRNTRKFRLALGDRESTMQLMINGDPLGDTHSLVAKSPAGTTGVPVEVVRGDTLVEVRGVPTPNVIKIDVEGFEEEVLSGLSHTLQRPECRAVFCEVHFGILERRGRRHAPVQIEAQFRQLGFKTKWLDSSHLAATRPDGGRARA